MSKLVTPYSKESGKKEQVEEMFDNIAGRYDMLNRLLSFGIDKRWRKKAIRVLKEDKPGLILDIATGTGDFALDALKLNPKRIDGLDLSAEMIAIGKKKITKKGGTMRLGAYACEIIGKNTKVYEAYRRLEIQERHRHRYEFNNKYLEPIREAGLIPTGINPGSGLVEIVELADHPWFVGVQFHPELKSTVENPHPLFVAFIKASLVHQQARSKKLAVSN